MKVTKQDQLNRGDLGVLSDIYQDGRQAKKPEGQKQVVRENATNQELDGAPIKDKGFEAAGPAKANGFQKPGDPATGKKKITKESVNNKQRNMKDQSLFDRIYKEAIGDEEQELGIGADDQFGFDNAPDGGAEGEPGAEVTVTLTPDQVDALRAVLDQVDGGAEGEGENPDFQAGPAESAPPQVNSGYRESAKPVEEENQHTADGMTPGQDPSGLSNTGRVNTVNTPNGNAFDNSGGSADASVTDDVGNQETQEGSTLGNDPSGQSKAGKVNSSATKKGQSK